MAEAVRPRVVLTLVIAFQFGPENVPGDRDPSPLMEFVMLLKPFVLPCH